MIRLFSVTMPASTVLLVLSETLLLFGCYYFSFYFTLDSSNDPWLYFLYDGGWQQIVLEVVVLQLGMDLMDLYDSPGRLKKSALLQQMFVVLGLAFLVQAFIAYLRSSLLALPRWSMIGGSLLVWVAVPLWRTLFFTMADRTSLRKVLFLGVSPALRDVARILRERPELGTEVVGYVDEAGPPAEPGIRYLGTIDRLEDLLTTYKPDSIAVSQDEQGGWVHMQRLLDLRLRGMNIESAGSVYETVLGRVSLTELRPAQLIFPAELGPAPWVMALQSAYSFVLGLVGMLISLPVLLLTGVLVKLTSPGPVLYRQERVGLRGRHFYLYKVRSMYLDAEVRSGPVWASKNDPRITPVGRWLRKLRLDELPQFWNVLRGDMALVGPRPERPNFCQILGEKIPFYHHRHMVKPGITGWAQINYAYAETIEDSVAKLEYDLYYIKHLAPSLDALIIFHTLKVMLLSRGAQ